MEKESGMSTELWRDKVTGDIVYISYEDDVPYTDTDGSLNWYSAYNCTSVLDNITYHYHKATYVNRFVRINKEDLELEVLAHI